MRFAATAAVLLAAHTICLSATILVPDDFPTIQAAIDNAAGGDTIIVRPGTYLENIDFAGKAIRLKSELGPGVTTIDGGTPADPDAASVATFKNGEGADSILEGFTITNGTGTTAADGYRYGGGIYCENSTAAIIDNRIIDNAAESSGHFPAAFGGGIQCLSSPLLISGNTIVGNRARASDPASGSAAWGGGICVWTCSGAAVLDNVISGNSAVSGGLGEARGGGIACVVSYPATVADNAISHNFAGWDGGGIYMEVCAGTLARNIVSQNSAQHHGGGIFGNQNASMEIDSNRMRGNRAACGGGIYLLGLSNKVTGNAMIANIAEDSGGGMYIRYTDATFVTNCTFSRNAALSGRGGGLYNEMSESLAANCIFWNDAPDEIHDIGSSTEVAYCCVQGGHAGTGNIDADPRFVDSGRGDLHLTWTSPCRDAGDNDSVVAAADIEGDPRIANGTVDMGADEYDYHLYCTGDAVPGGRIDVNIAGIPGVHAALALGSGLLYPPWPTPYGDFYLKFPLRALWNLGPLPQSGVGVYPFTLPAAWAPGEEHSIQAIAGRLTNPVTLEVE